MPLLLVKLLVYGHLGLLIEVWFTGTHGFIFKRDLRMKAVTYLPMVLIYGVTALVLEVVSEILPWPFYLKAFVYVLIIFCAEASSGWLLKHLTGRIPWDYGESRWTPMGLINLKYSPYWLILAMCFDSITAFLTKLLQAVALVT